MRTHLYKYQNDTNMIFSLKPFLVSIGLMIIFFSCNTTQTIEADYVIENVDVIDANSGLQKSKSVFIQNNRIKKVSNFGEVKIKSGTGKVIDGSGKFLIPGLWDAHVHLTFDPLITPTMFKLFLAFGVTSVRDTGGLMDLVMPEREKARRDPENTPRVMVAGPLLDGVPTVYDGSGQNNPHIGMGQANPEEASAYVDQLIEKDVDLLKAYEMLTPETFRTIIQKGKDNGLQVTGHVPLSMDVIEASNAGMNSMEHLRNLEFACSEDWEKLLETRKKLLFDGKDEAGYYLRKNIHKAQRQHAIENQSSERRALVLKHLSENETWQIPTLTITTSSAELFYGRPDWQESFKYLPDTIQKKWAGASMERAAQPIDSYNQLIADWHLEMINHLKKADVDIMAGTDTPIYFLTPGFSLHEELALLVKGGLSPLEAIEAATTKPAEYFGLEKELGLIQDGMLADLVLLNKNPLEDIRNSNSINTVIRNGKLHDRAALDQLLESLMK